MDFESIQAGRSPLKTANYKQLSPHPWSVSRTVPCLRLWEVLLLLRLGPPWRCQRSTNKTRVSTNKNHVAVGQNLVPLVNIKIAGKWMFIPLKMVLIGIDPYPFSKHLLTSQTRIWWTQRCNISAAKFRNGSNGQTIYVTKNGTFMVNPV